jgi:hypothetical protein
LKPTPDVLALQLASMSCVCLLFGFFFASQAFNRLYKEWKDGSLGQKMDKVFASHGASGTSVRGGESARPSGAGSFHDSQMESSVKVESQSSFKEIVTKPA